MLNWYLAAMKQLLILYCLGLTLNSFGQSNNVPLKTYLALGDSYTIGESVTEALRWPNQLIKQLNEKEVVFDPATIIAKTGWTTDELMEGINTSSLDDHYSYVSLLIGVNNQYRGRSLENFKDEFILLLEKAITFSGGNNKNVFVLSIPDWGVMPFAKGRNQEKIAKEIDAFNQIVSAVCADYKITFIDITPISRRASKQPNLIATDGLHPSGDMYALWVNQVVARFKF